MKSYLLPEFVIERDDEKCIRCEVCVRQCAFEVHTYDEEDDIIVSDNFKCVGCHRCLTLCPTQAITVKENPLHFKENFNWTALVQRDIYKQAETGGVLLTGMGSDKAYPIYWDHILLDASQVTNPSIDPLREPMEIRTYLGRKPDKVQLTVPNLQKREKSSTMDYQLSTKLSPQLKLETPILFSAMSYGSISLNACKSLARAATEVDTLYNTGEGGLHPELYKYGKNTIVQVASGRFGVHKEYLDVAAAIEIKIGQGAKPGIGGHLPGEKVSEEISKTRMIQAGTDALSPAPHHDIYSIEDLRQLIYALKEATNYTKPVAVKIAAVHNSAAIASGMVRAGADIIALDGVRGGTGAAPTVIRDNVGIPIELALAAVDS
ncbi:MAG: FMN-binding glutamate synthase family protein, partial [Armatimonadetes bacterium CG07_land_8_20_14_0_80_40_9]